MSQPAEPDPLAAAVAQCVWIVPGDPRRLCVASLNHLMRGEALICDLCKCCGETVECDEAHLCTDCCQGRT